MLLCAILAGFLGVLAATAPGSASQSSEPAAATIDRRTVERGDLPFDTLIAQPFIERHPRNRSVILVDVSNTDPKRVFDALEAGRDALDGMTVVYRGLRVETSEDRRALDDQLMSARDSRQSSAPRCPAKPATNRASDGSTTAYLGCDPGTGAQKWSTSARSSGHQPMASAFDEAVTAAVGMKISGIGVEQVGEVLRIDLPSEVASMRDRLQKSGGAQLEHAVLFTAFSNESIDVVEITIRGDCMLFAFTVGGDTCSTVHMEELEQ